MMDTKAKICCYICSKLGKTGSDVCHYYTNCVEVKDRCLRCLDENHLVTACTVKHPLVRKGRDCYRCKLILRKEIHPVSLKGSACSCWYKERVFMTMLWLYQTDLADLELTSGMRFSNLNDYTTWLLTPRGDGTIKNLEAVFVYYFGNL
jgi:hypothetical protein